MKGSYYLSQILGIEKLKSGVFNLVEAPCGSGKSEWAFSVLAPSVQDKSKIIYLIDTINGREQFLRRDDTCHYSQTWFDMVKTKMIHFEPEPQKIVVMTYALFGILAKRDFRFGHSFDYIVCDEGHNLIHFQTFGSALKESNNYAAQCRLESICTKGGGKIVGITATPAILCQKLTSTIHEVLSPPEREQLHHYETGKITGYANIKELVKEAAANGGKGICYIARIQQMKDLYAIAADNAKIGMFWSVDNKDHPMTAEQLQLRQYIIDNQRLPNDIDLLIINASSETSINIRGHIDYMIIHNSNEDTCTQVRGRYRDDLETLYIHDKSAALIVPYEYLGQYLYKEDTDKLCELFNRKNVSGRLKKWPTIQQELVDTGYTISHQRIRNRHAYMILDTRHQ